MQKDLPVLRDYSVKWQMRFDFAKCKVKHTETSSTSTPSYHCSRKLTRKIGLYKHQLSVHWRPKGRTYHRQMANSPENTLCDYINPQCRDSVCSPIHPVSWRIRHGGGKQVKEWVPWREMIESFQSHMTWIIQHRNSLSGAENVRRFSTVQVRFRKEVSIHAAGGPWPTGGCKGEGMRREGSLQALLFLPSLLVVVSVLRLMGLWSDLKKSCSYDSFYHTLYL